MGGRQRTSIFFDVEKESTKSKRGSKRGRKGERR